MFPVQGNTEQFMQMDLDLGNLEPQIKLTARFFPPASFVITGYLNGSLHESFNFFLSFTEVYLIYKAVIISAVQKK